MEKVDFNSKGTEQLLHSLGFQALYTHFQQARPLRYGETPSLHGEIASYVKEQYPQGLYLHQCKAVERALLGENVVISTGTASGKTVAFALPVFEKLLEDEDARALFFYPTKALAGDQLKSLHQMATHFGMIDKVFPFDGDTGQEVRKKALKQGRILLCTPDILHATMLRRNQEPEYNELFKNLKYIILDECHIYTGAFGSNMAFLLRRLRQVTCRLGGEPQFMAASATSRDPKMHMEKLTGKEFTVITEKQNGSPTGGREFYMVEPLQGADNLASIKDLILNFIQNKKRFLVFCHSRRMTEQHYMELINSHPEVEGRVMPYRSGYEPNDRQAIEKSLRSGELLGVFSTSALELGMDLPNMEYCTLVGLPTTSMSFWQRVGRVGRSSNGTGKIVIFPSGNSLDDYYKEHPEKYFFKDLEDLVIHLDNRKLILAHFACARAEGDNFEKPTFDESIFGRDFVSFAKNINNMDITDDILIKPEPHWAIGLRGIDDPTYEIYTLGGEQRLGTISWSHILREAYPHAVYRHMGEAYRVERLLPKEQMLKVKKEKRSATTSPVGYITVKERTGIGGTIYRKASFGEHMEMWHTTVAVTTKTVGYREKIKEQWLQKKYPIPLMRRVESEGIWFRFDREFGILSREALNTLAHVISNIYTILFPCDPAEIATYCVSSKNNDYAYIYVFDTTSGGLGFTAKLFDEFIGLLPMVKERLLKCEHCDSDSTAFDKGCPACVQAPRWYEDNERLSKKEAVQLLSRIEETITMNPHKITETSSFEARARGGFSSLYSTDNEAEEGEVATRSERYGHRLFIKGSTIQLKSGLKGEILKSAVKEGQVIYQICLENDKEINLRDMGSNLTLVEGEENYMCLCCGAEDLSALDGLCPFCGVEL